MMLWLMPRVRFERSVEALTIKELLRVPEERDTRRGVFHQADVENDRAVPSEQRELHDDDLAAAASSCAHRPRIFSRNSLQSPRPRADDS